MAFQVPGVQGKPIHAHNFTGRFRRNPRILTWVTMMRSAYFSDTTVTRLVPRKGPHLARYDGPTPLWVQEAEGYEFSNFSGAGGSDRWHISEQFPNTGLGFGASVIVRPSAGYVEPMSIRFRNGDLIYPAPNHGNSSGLRLRSASSDFSVAGLPSITNNGLAVQSLNFSYRYSDRRVSWQAGLGEIVTATAPIEWERIHTIDEFNIVMGQAWGAQAFSGAVLEVGLWNSDFLSNPEDVSLVGEYASVAYGV